MKLTPRTATQSYQDPLDALWLATARQLGLTVRRSTEVYASTDGQGVMTLGSDETLDSDDCLAQMIFHECCHWLVEGTASERLPDWGLDNITDRDQPREMACLRLQAFLAERHGLRAVLAPTTDFRAYYDALPADPFEPRHDPSVAPAILALARADDEVQFAALHAALEATGEIVRAAARVVTLDEEAPASELLWLSATEPLEQHPHGRPLSAVEGRTCGDCAWRHERGSGARATSRCRQSEDARVDVEWPACERWEAALDCRTCGGCCRAAYDAVIVPPRDPVLKVHPDLIVRRENFQEVRREGNHCCALVGGPAAGATDLTGFAPWSCTIYDTRPKPCRSFELGGDNCIIARRRVGFSL